MTHQPRFDIMESLTFDNRFVEDLPADPDLTNTRRQVYGSCYSRVTPRKATAPKLVAWAREVADLLDLPESFCRSDAFLQIFSGSRLTSRMDPYATCYGGHQFGNWAGQLGDGRAINLGEIVNHRSERWALQLKGAGPTPYSRTADGLAVLRSSVREFLCSEAMHHLGIPTTRALSLILTGDPVERDMFYDGHPKEEPGAVVCRVAPSFTRFGNFEIFSSRKDLQVLKTLLDYTIRVDFPHLEPENPDVYVEWFRLVCRLTARMIVHWMRVGFVHGVMNTDNMSILGLTIDYGPYGWLDNYDPGWTPNTTDAATRRYVFGNQPGIAQWNLLRLANAVYPLVEKAEPLQEALALYSEDFERGWQQMMARKIGLESYDAQTDDWLIKELLSILTLAETDMTLFFRELAQFDISRKTDKNNVDPLATSVKDAYYQPEQITSGYRERFGRWVEAYAARLEKNPLNTRNRQILMNRINPKYVLRNYLAQEAIDRAEKGDFTRIHDLLEVMRRPYDEQPRHLEFARKRPEWARNKPGCSMLSCSS